MSYTIKFVMGEHEVKVLQEALKTYPKKKAITQDLLNLIEYEKNEQSNKIKEKS